ncbi:MAG: hypothetical protein JW844_06595 [Candidatus Omnitrophica bacterium]|nr:hypothetical protein [Candidatus Omnitrophota bacterium]
MSNAIRTRWVLSGLIGIAVFLAATIACAAEEKQLQRPGEIPRGNVQFSASGGLLYFFDEATGILYLYNSSTGRALRRYKVTELGVDLERMRD